MLYIMQNTHTYCHNNLGVKHTSEDESNCLLSSNKSKALHFAGIACIQRIYPSHMFFHSHWRAGCLAEGGLYRPLYQPFQEQR